MSVGHYENFPVASWLCPAALRPAVIAIYRFARTADDLADEGQDSSRQRLVDLAAYRADLHAVARGEAPSTRWRGVFEPLASALERHRLPTPLLADLLSAFEQDVVQSSYRDREELIDYCRRSANPIGRLLLHLYGRSDATTVAQSDAICTSLQLINFWQDLSIDLARGRLYAPLADCDRFGVVPDDLRQRRASLATNALVADLCHWARALMLDGASLATSLPGRVGWELRLVVQGGLRILDKIADLGFATVETRPRLRRWDLAPMLFGAVRMGQ